MTRGKKTGLLLLILLIVAIGFYPFTYLSQDKSESIFASKGTFANSWLWRGPFFLHIFAGGLALLTGWSQFISDWRKRWPGLHRALGKSYIVCVGVSGISGLRLAFDATGGWLAGFGFGSLALVWLLTTIIAYRCIRQQRWQDHQQWMMRSFALTLAAVTLRLQLPFSVGVLHLDFIPAYQAIAWLCWVPNLLLAEYMIRRLPSYQK